MHVISLLARVHVPCTRARTHIRNLIINTGHVLIEAVLHMEGSTFGGARLCRGPEAHQAAHPHGTEYPVRLTPDGAWTMRSCLPWPRLCSEPPSEANRSSSFVGVYDGEVGEAGPLYSGETGPVAAPLPSSSDDRPWM